MGATQHRHPIKRDFRHFGKLAGQHGLVHVSLDWTLLFSSSLPAAAGGTAIAMAAKDRNRAGTGTAAEVDCTKASVGASGDRESSIFADDTTCNAQVMGRS